jgi:hypothetical protein
MSTLEQEDTIQGDGSHISKNVQRLIEQVLMNLQASGGLALTSLSSIIIGYAVMTTRIKLGSEKAKEIIFNLVPFSIVILISVSLFAATLTTAYTGLLEIDSNCFGFPFAWKTIISQEPFFQAIGFVIDIIFWSALYSPILTGLIIQLKRWLK